MAAARLTGRKFAFHDTYVDVQPMLRALVRKYQRQHGGEFHELMSEANLHFVNCYHRHDPERQTFENYLKYKVFRNMISTARKIASDAKHVLRPIGDARRPEGDDEAVAFVENATAKVEPKFQLTDFLHELSEDAREVARMAIQMPAEVRLSLKQRKGDSGFHIKLALIEFLKDLGWERDRIVGAFEEVKEALSGY